MVGTKETMSVTVRVMFGHTILSKGADPECSISVAADGSDTVQAVKAKIAEAFGGTISRDQLLLYFGPNERCIGKQYLGDPTVDESAQTLSQFSVLSWLQRFPHWRLGVRLLPAAPPAPGVATFRAAAMSEGKDPDQAVQEARTKGEIPALMDLPAPWGPKPYVASAADAAHSPAKYPEGFSPLDDNVKPVSAMYYGPKFKS